jgi:hypothetical protein
MKAFRSFAEVEQTAKQWFEECDELLIDSYFSVGDSDYFFCRSLD